MISGFTHGWTEECMKDSTGRIRNMDTEFIHGVIRKSIQAGGSRANSMV